MTSSTTGWYYTNFGIPSVASTNTNAPITAFPRDKPKVYAYYKETDGWSKEEVDEQVFSKYDITQIRK